MTSSKGSGSGSRARSPEARKRRAQKFRVVSDGGRRIACDACKHLHKPPVCPPDVEPVQIGVLLPPHVARELKERVEHGERSKWLVRLIRKELDV